LAKPRIKIFSHTDPATLEKQIEDWLEEWSDEIKILETRLVATVIRDQGGELIMRDVLIRYQEIEPDDPQ
jgi:hypothetical protein